MTSRGMKLGGDLDGLAYASEEEFATVLKKFLATKNVKAETALRWALQRAVSEEDRARIRKKVDELYASGSALID